jgi:hypothetical protein
MKIVPTDMKPFRSYQAISRAPEREQSSLIFSRLRSMPILTTFAVIASPMPVPALFWRTAKACS